MPEPIAQQVSARPCCLVTGASRGIGRAICEDLARVGFDLVCWARTPIEPIDCGPSEGTGGRVVYQRVDVSDRESVRSAFRELDAQGVVLTSVVINAGIGHWTTLRSLDHEEWRDTLATNLDGAYHVLKSVLSAFRTELHPVVVGILSDSALYGFPARAAYSASKAGLRALLEVARREERSRGVRFSLIYPSRVDTHFAGSHKVGVPGLRPEGLRASDVAAAVTYVLMQPVTVEIRELQLAAITDTFGPFQERSAHND
ncbi:MAG: SDR family oxidoreductase [Rhodanobacter sp.]